MPGKNATTDATSVAGYLAQLPPDRRRELGRLRTLVREHLPPGYEEALVRGMIVYQVPLGRYADTYNGHALWYAALAAQKQYLVLHLMPVYGSSALEAKLRDAFAAAGKKLDMGKACIRFRAADDLALDAIAEVVAAVPIDDWVAYAEAARRRVPQRRGRKPAP